MIKLVDTTVTEIKKLKGNDPFVFWLGFLGFFYFLVKVSSTIVEALFY